MTAYRKAHWCDNVAFRYAARSVLLDRSRRDLPCGQQQQCPNN